ncbi:MAG: DNA cytosine methyltransferase [Clostridiaceae bacterium]|nr:DNA cytosine methyltransferase [Clostridiaceae bacterium]
MINAVSLFANVGIAETFLEECGINVVVANEKEHQRAELYQHLYPNCRMIEGDITDDQVFDEVVRQSIDKKCRLLIATPPCQGMSVAGKRDYTDARNSLIVRAVEAIEKIDPDYIIIENVVQQLKTKINYMGKTIIIKDFLQEKLQDKYYINKNKVLNVEDYGVPQNRKRSIILMSKHGQWEFPDKEFPKKTVRETIGHLPSVEAIVKEKDKSSFFENNHEKIKECKNVHKWHIPREHPWRHIEAMMHTPTGKSAFDNEIYYPKKIDGTRVKGYNTTYKRMEWDKPAPTITVSNGAISSQCNVHPGRKKEDGTYSDARALTIYELMLLTTLPDDWNIPDDISDNLIRKVIGEGIPPLVMKKIVKNMP